MMINVRADNYKNFVSKLENELRASYFTEYDKSISKSYINKVIRHALKLNETGEMGLSKIVKVGDRITVTLRKIIGGDYSIDFNIGEWNNAYSIKDGCYYQNGMFFENIEDYKKYEQVCYLRNNFFIDFDNVKHEKYPEATVLKNCVPRSIMSVITIDNVRNSSFLKEYFNSNNSSYNLEYIRANCSGSGHLVEDLVYYIDSVVEVTKKTENGVINERHALIQRIDSIFPKILVVTDESLYYNYIDSGRLIYVTNDGDNNVDVAMAFDVQNNIEDMISMMPSLNTVLRKKRVTNDGFNYISNDEILSEKKKRELEEKRRERERQIAEKKNQKYREQLNNIDNKPFEKNGITFNRHSFSYQGITVDTKGFFDFEDYLRERQIDSLEDFNDMFRTVIYSIMGVWMFSNTFEAERQLDKSNLKRRPVNIQNYNYINLEIDGKNIVITNEVDSKTIKYKINGIRINKLEIAECITHALCYQNIEDFNKFLSNVSSCSLKFHKAITNNIKKHIRFGSDNYSGTIELKMTREKSRNWLVCGKRKIRISDTNRLIDLQPGNLKEMVKLLLETTEANVNDIKIILKEAKDRYIEAVKRAEQLFNQTLQKFKVEERNDGYVVHGKSGRSYLITDKGGDYGIHILDENGNKAQYVCIVDRTSANQVGKDALVSRIYALANDTLIADKISTLNV